MSVDETRGKGPYARRKRARDAPASHWLVPRIDIDAAVLQRFVAYVESRAEGGTASLFRQLAEMSPRHRLARNLSATLRVLAESEDSVTDALQHGLSAAEHAALFDLERRGISVESLAVGHELLHVRDRQRLVTRFGDLFSTPRICRGVRLNDAE